MIDEFDEDSPDDLASTGFIACKACGARIRANREACLRCGEPLEAAAPTVTLKTISSGRPMLVAIAIAAGVVAMFVVFWINRPSIEQEPAQPYSGSRAAAPSAPAQVAASSASAPAAAPSGEPRSEQFANPARAVGSDAATGDVTAARAALEKTLAEDPNDSDAMNDLALVLARMGDLIGATRRFDAAIALAPDKWAYHFNLAGLYAQQTQWDRAVSEYRIAGRLLPTDYATQFNLAMAFHKAGNDQAAIPEYQSAIRLGLSEAGVHASLGNSLAKTGKLAEAQKEYQQYLDMAPSAPDAAAVKAQLDAVAARRGW